MKLLPWRDEEGMSPGEIAETYDAPVEGVEAALNWADENGEEVRYLEIENEVKGEASRRRSREELEERLGDDA